MTELEKLSLSQPLTDVYNAMEQDIMLAIAKQLAKDGSISASSEWRLQRLAEAGDLNKTVIGIIASYTGIQSDLLTEALSGAANSVIDKLEPAFQEIARQGLISDTPVPASKSVDRAIQTFHKQAASDLNLVNTVMRYKAKQAYVDLVNKTYDAVNAVEDVSNRQELLNTLGKHTMSTVMGAESRQEAVRKCIREFNSKGIPAFVDAAGREWSPEAYINMDIRTTVSNTANAAQDARCDDYGIDLIAVSSHPGARPKCAKDQGKVYSRSNKSGIAHDGNGKEIPYEPLSSTSYGEPDGLFGINCRHKKYPFIDGVNFQRYFPYDKEENDKRYKEIQEQRRLERKVRNTKREADMLKEVGDTDGAKAARAKLKEQRKAYRTYCDEHELTQRNDRLTVSKGSVSAAKTQKPLDNGGGSGIMKETTKAPAKTLSLSNLNEFEEWQNKYYDYNSGVSFSREDNPNIFTYTGGAYDAINALERGGEQLNKAMRCYGDLSEYEGIGEKISEELSKFKLPEPINVRRAVGNVDYITGATSSVEDMKNSIGKVFTEKGFTSTTICADSALPFASSEKTKFTRATLEIYVPPNSRGAYIYKISEHPAEFEYLLDKNTKFKIIDAGEREVIDKYTSETTIERFMKLEVIPDD